MNTDASEAAYMAAKGVASGQFSQGFALNRRTSLGPGLGPEVDPVVDYGGPFTARMKQKLSSLYDVLGIAEQDLTQFRARMLGPWPEPGQSTSDGSKQGRLPGEVEEIMLFLDLIMARAQGIVGTTQVITSNI